MADTRTDPIERAARAAVADLKTQQDAGRGELGWLDEDGGLQRVIIDGEVDMLSLVRAVIAAIREPSEGMMKPGTLFSHFYHDADGLEDNAYFEPEEALKCWQAMIDALLAEEG